MLETRIVSSLTKIFPDKVMGNKIKAASALKNEPFSFQVAYKNSDIKSEPVSFFIRVESDIDIGLIAQYAEGYVPLLKCVPQNTDDYFDRKESGLFPDMLYRRNTVSTVENDGFWVPKLYEQNEKYQLSSVPDAYQGLWFTVNEEGAEIKPGKYPISIVFCDCSNGKEIVREAIELEIIDAVLPKQEILYTSWFHCDCLADLYDVEMFSDRHFRIIESFVKEAAKTGMNMILLPAFTPPLDTPVGKERRTAQLVRIELKDGEYSFDFSLMERFIKLCLKCGITHFEHCHLFTQWGAKFAPKIMAEVNGEYKRIFGWDTDSRSEEYASFLKAYLRALLPFLDRVGVGKNILFHISDEPTEDNIEYYGNAIAIVKNEIKGYHSGDALSHYEFYKNGSVETPIVYVDSEDIDKFIENCDNLWLYYTADFLRNGIPNRTIPCTGARNRILGTQIYHTGAKGFLHWGYNYYYDVLSHGLFNPAVYPGGYGRSAGSSFMVYADCNGTAIPSIRMKIFYEGLNDQRALCTLEALTGRQEAEKLINKHFGKLDFHTVPTNDELLQFREEVNQCIKNNI